ncbi:hypothetical protein GCM10028862_08150 [Luteimonas pelagia]
MFGKTRLIGLIVLGGIALSGCDLVKFFQDACDYDSGSATATCRPSFVLRSHKAPITSAELAAFDANGVAADLGQGNVPVLSNTSTATIRLKVDDTTYASRTFTVNRSGDALRLADPVMVNRWLRATAVGATAIEMDIDGVRVGSVTGTNVFSLVLKYLGTDVAAATDSWHHAQFPDGDFRRMQ